MPLVTFRQLERIVEPTTTTTTTTTTTGYNLFEFHLKFTTTTTAPEDRAVEGSGSDA